MIQLKEQVPDRLDLEGIASVNYAGDDAMTSPVECRRLGLYGLKIQC
jgi:hypothetical protein